MAGPAIRDLDLYRGDDYTHEFLFVKNVEPPTPMNLSGYTFRAQIRDRPEKSSNIRATFDIDITRAGVGIIVISLPPSATRIDSGYWDLEANDGNSIMTWLRGAVTMVGDVTQGVMI